MSTDSRVAGIPTNAVSRFDHIDALRAFSVLIVVVSHTGFPWVPGDSGVTVFFGISGFIITWLVIRERQKSGGFSARGFYTRRLLKLGPPFVLVIVIPTLIYSLFAKVNLGAFLSQVFFSYNWARVFFHGTADQVLPGSEPVWSLAVEEQFYIVFALIWLLLVRSRHWQSGLIILSAVALVASFATRTVLSADASNVVHILRGTDTRMEALAWGMLAAALYSFWRAGTVRWLAVFGRDFFVLVAAVLFFGGLAFQGGFGELVLRQTMQALAGVLIILYGMIPTATIVKRGFYRVLAWKPLQVTGLASYSIYLVNYPLADLIQPLFAHVPTIVRVGVSSILAVLVGIAIYYLVEIPALRVRNRIMKRRTQFTSTRSSRVAREVGT